MKIYFCTPKSLEYVKNQLIDDQYILELIVWWLVFPYYKVVLNKLNMSTRAPIDIEKILGCI